MAFPQPFNIIVVLASLFLLSYSARPVTTGDVGHILSAVVHVQETTDSSFDSKRKPIQNDGFDLQDKYTVPHADDAQSFTEKQARALMTATWALNESLNPSLVVASVERVDHPTNQGNLTCPMDYDVPLANGQPSRLHLNSVANFLEPNVQDQWWNVDHVERYYRPSDKYRLGESKIAGCGVFAAEPIKAGEKIGIVWVKDLESYKTGDPVEMVPRHFTPWFGRAVNHCNCPNSRLWQDDRGTVFSVAIRDIEAGEEVTGDYNEATRQFPMLVSRADPSWTC